jgi:hypothetical protein
MAVLLDKNSWCDGSVGDLAALLEVQQVDPGYDVIT